MKRAAEHTNEGRNAEVMDYEKLRIMRNEQNAFGDLAGVRIVEIKEGYARTELDVKPELLNPIGSLHGGCLFTMADITGGSAAVSHGEQVTTADADIRYLLPGINVKRLTAESREIKKGKNLLVYQVEIRDEKERLLAAATLTYMSLHRKIEL